MLKKLQMIMVCSILLFSSVSAIIPASKSYALGNVNLTADLSSQGTVITNKFSDINVWDFNIHWTTAAAGQPANYFATSYPFVKRVQFMTATGGCYIGYSGCTTDRDLFVNPADLTTMTDYKFSGIIGALHNVVNQGLKPEIITGNVPIKFTASPSIGGFGVNVRPPDNYNTYYNYIKALADALVVEFGINEVKTWSWGVLTEYENPDWFTDGISASTTKIAYFKLYDYTVEALKASIGASNLNVGAHAVAFVDNGGYWDESEFIDHVATGTNYKTGTTGTQINYLSSSFYDNQPGSYSSRSVADAINGLRTRAVIDGLTNLKYGFDEGRILNGNDGRDLFSRSVAHSYQGASDAKLFKSMVENNIDWFTAWGLSTEAFWGGVPSVSTHVSNLVYKMIGDKQVSSVLSGSPGDSANDVNGMVTFNSPTNTVHAMMYNNNGNINSTTGETPVITINNIAPVTGTTVTVKQWYIDDTHGNFWPTWFADQTTRGLTNASYSWSKYSLEVPKHLVNTADISYWYSRESTYKTLATLSSTTTTPTVTGNTLTLSPSLAHHGVVYYEITNAKNSSASLNATDDLNDWTKSSSHTSGVVFDTSNPVILEDPSRASRNNTNASPAENITYHYDNMNSFAVTALYATDHESINNMKFYTSPNGTTWTQQTGWTNADTLINSNNWTKRVYTLNTLPSGTNYLKVEFPTGGCCTFNPQLSKVSINYTPVLVIYTDELNDLTHASSHSAGVQIDTSNASLVGDSSRACRTNINASPAEYMVYNYSNITAFNVTGLFSTDYEAINNFKFYTSPNGTTWTQQTGWGNTDTPINGGLWTKRVYALNSIPSGTNYLKVEWPTGGTLIYNPQLSQVKVTAQ